MDEARYEIERSIKEGGPFTRKILNIVLPAFSNYYGPKYTNELIKEYDLTSRYGIKKLEDGMS